jgi:hypothetical protein
MKYALVDGERREAERGRSGQCPGCGNAMVAKCGAVRVHHWSHAGRRNCDPWWENETEWHRAWKNHFPVAWQEIVHRADDGELHIADVKTGDGWVLEFQHSHIRSEERRSREAFYQRLIWVVDGTRRERDLSQFRRAWEDGRTRHADWSRRILHFPEGAAFRDWRDSNAHVFFDFGEEKWLWWLWPGSSEQRAYVHEVPRAEFIQMHADVGDRRPITFLSRLQLFARFVASYEPAPPVAPPPPSPPPSAAPTTPQIPPYRNPLAPPIRRKFRF